MKYKHEAIILNLVEAEIQNLYSSRINKGTYLESLKEIKFNL